MIGRQPDKHGSKYGGYRGIWPVGDATLLREKWLATEPPGVYVTARRGLGTTRVTGLRVESLNDAADARRAAEELLGFAEWLEREPE